MIKRKLISKLIAHLDRKEISIIIGSRQSGKTTVMDVVRHHLTQQGEKTLYLNHDIEFHRPHFESHLSIVKKIELELGKHKGFVFLDEIQRKENAGLFLKGLFDLKLPYKFIVSGSGSLELKEKIHESLAGRKRLFELTTLTFDEFVDYKTDYKYSKNLSSFFEIEPLQGIQLLEEYLNFGGFPRVVLETELSEKLLIISEIYQSILEKDIAYLMKLDKPESFSLLIRLLSGHVGSLINYSNLSKLSSVSFQTTKKYLWYAQKTFIINLVTPFYKNTNKEITKSPIPYFNDLGFRNYATNSFGNLIDPKTAGLVFENFVFLILKEITRNQITKINFWRTKDQAEVDFVLDDGYYQIPIEVKYKTMNSIELSRSFRSFIEKYSPEKAFLVNLNYKAESRIGKTTVHFIPYYDLLFHSII